MRSVAGLRSLYDRELRPILHELERRRSRWLWTSRVTSLGSLALGVWVSSWLLFVRGSGGWSAAALAGGCLVAILCFSRKRPWPEALRRDIVPRIVHYFDPGFRYEFAARLDVERMLASQLFSPPDRIYASDSVSGRIGETDFELVELELMQRSADDESRSYETTFQGAYFVADFHKDFRTTTLVLPDHDERLLGRLARFLQRVEWEDSLPLLELEDPEFERLFVVRGEDPVEARYLLTPGMMKRLVDLRRRSGHLVRVSFSGSRVHVGVALGRGLFDAPDTERLDDFDRVRGYYEDLELLCGIVEDLNLNTRIWSKA